MQKMGRFRKFHDEALSVHDFFCQAFLDQVQESLLGCQVSRQVVLPSHELRKPKGRDPGVTR